MPICPYCQKNRAEACGSYEAAIKCGPYSRQFETPTGRMYLKDPELHSLGIQRGDVPQVLDRDEPHHTAAKQSLASVDLRALEARVLAHVMQESLTVTISGPQGSGKTILGQFLKAFFPNITINERQG